LGEQIMIVPGAVFVAWAADSSSGECDPYWNNVVLAMHMDGTNGSTTFTDEKGNTVTAYSDAQISTARSPFVGGSSALFDGNDYLIVPTSPSFDIGTQDFTVDGWIYDNTSWGTSREVFSLINDSGDSWNGRFYIGRNNSDPTKLTAVVYDSSGSATTLLGSIPLPASQWVHFEFSRSGSTYRLFQDGVQVATSSPTLISHNHTGITIGSGYPTDAGFIGNVADLRFTVGNARNTSAFTPPTAPFAEVAC
jgi:hypothetical protein